MVLVLVTATDVISLQLRAKEMGTPHTHILRAWLSGTLVPQDLQLGIREEPRLSPTFTLLWVPPLNIQCKASKIQTLPVSFQQPLGSTACHPSHTSIS